MPTTKFFITHSWKDIDFARKLCDDLRASGLDGFFDERSVRPGESIPSRIERGLKECDVYLPVFSPEALESPWCEWEIDMAITMNRTRKGRPRIIPVIAKSCDVPDRLMHILHINFVRRYSDALDELLTKGLDLSAKAAPDSDVGSKPAPVSDALSKSAPAGDEASKPVPVVAVPAAPLAVPVRTQSLPSCLLAVTTMALFVVVACWVSTFVYGVMTSPTSATRTRVAIGAPTPTVPTVILTNTPPMTPKPTDTARLTVTFTPSLTDTPPPTATSTPKPTDTPPLTATFVLRRTDTPLPTAIPPLGIGEKLVVSFAAAQGVTTTNAYKGRIHVSVSGTGSADRSSQDAFYLLGGVLRDDFWTFQINNKAASRLITRPLYSSEHRYDFSLDLGDMPSKITFKATSDTFVADNDGQLVVTISTPENLSVPFTTASSVITRNEYKGRVHIAVSGTGSADKVIQDAFYFLDGRLRDDFWTFHINGKAAVRLTTRPPYSSEHTYDLFIDLGSVSQKISFQATADVFVTDNSGSLQVEVASTD